MQVMLLYTDEAAWARMSVAERNAELSAYRAYTAALREAGLMIAGAPLQPTATGHTIRIADGAPQTLDGPFAEIRRQLRGYFLLEVDDMADELRWAARCPGGAHGTVEVRPLKHAPFGGSAKRFHSIERCSKADTRVSPAAGTAGRVAQAARRRLPALLPARNGGFASAERRFLLGAG